MDSNINSQQVFYEKSYEGPFDNYGMPDRKIADGKDLQNLNILDIGCGNGSDVWYLAAKNLLVGLDFAVSGLKVAQLHGIKAIAIDLNKSIIPFTDKSFDIIVCKDIFEHLLDPLTCLIEAYRVLKDDGYIVVNVPNHFYYTMRLRILLGKGLLWKTFGRDHSRYFEEWDYMHIRFFTYRGFVKFLRRGGFSPQKWFWDFGNLAHYNNPDMWIEPQLYKKNTGKPLSLRGKMGLYVIRPLWHLFNAVFPSPIRARIVGLAPGLLCSGFYVIARKEASRCRIF